MVRGTWRFAPMSNPWSWRFILMLACLIALAACSGGITPAVRVTPTPAPLSPAGNPAAEVTLIPPITTALAATAIPTDQAATALEARWGVRITQFQVTADGGMIDLRFEIRDPQKALPMLTGVQNVPAIVDSTSQTIIRTTQTMDPNTNLAKGKIYTFLYANPNRVLTSGKEVSLVIGDLRLDHVLVK